MHVELTKFLLLQIIKFIAHYLHSSLSVILENLFESLFGILKGVPILVSSNNWKLDLNRSCYVILVFMIVWTIRFMLTFWMENIEHLGSTVWWWKLCYELQVLWVSLYIFGDSMPIFMLVLSVRPMLWLFCLEHHQNLRKTCIYCWCSETKFMCWGNKT